MGFGGLQIKTQTATVNTLCPLIKTPPLDMTGGREQSEQGNVWVDGRRGGGVGECVCARVCVRLSSYFSHACYANAGQGQATSSCSGVAEKVRR